MAKHGATPMPELAELLGKDKSGAEQEGLEAVSRRACERRGGGQAKYRAKPGQESVHPKPGAAEKSDGKASIRTSIFNLANNVAGAGILTLAAGKASGTGWVPSILTCIALAFCSAHTFILIGKACELTGEKTFKGLWALAFGSKTAWIVDSVHFQLVFWQFWYKIS